MLEPFDMSRFETALATPRGWVEFGVVLACIGLAWLFDRALETRRRAQEGGRHRPHHGRLRAGFVRIVFPLTALALLVVARIAFRHFGPRSIFIDIAMPFLLALAAIRMAVYAMRKVFASQAWLKTGERAIAFSIWAVAILYFTGVLPDLADELDAIRIPVGRSEVTLLSLGSGILAVILTLIVTLWLSGLIEQRLVKATSFDTNTKAVLGKFVRAVLLVVGVLVALQAIGFDLTLLTVFGGALGVGIGLGLQKLAANYIAGFTILLDRSIRLGDMITVDNRYGVVSRVTSRYVVVKSLDGVEAIVPNETLITTTVLNHSYTTPEIRIGLPFQVAYDSDIELALKLMEEAARVESRVMGPPNGPTGFLVSFGDSGVNLELGLWLRDPENGQLALKSSLNRRIYQAFKANDISFPFPRRDVRLLIEPENEPGTEPGLPSGGQTKPP
jgi:small-conductance mechanosensitive channel